MFDESTLKLLKIFSRYCSYKSTLNFPNFKLPIKQKSINDATNIPSLLSKHIPYKNSTKTFVIEDGPPYANGDPHVGHALNKILKDIVRMNKTLEGYQVEFNVGWDCHGLPIEMKAKTTNVLKDDPLELRRKARNVAKHFIDVQKQQFRSWAVHSNWDKPYLTMDYSYQSKEIQAFNIMLEKKLIFRDSLPTFWSCSSKTALAEAELEYNPNHISQALFVKLPLKDTTGICSNYPANLLIWTTTPWTLVANEAVGVDRNMRYLIGFTEDSDERLIFGEFALNLLQEKIKSSIQVESSLNGDELLKRCYQHPVFNRAGCQVVHADFVSSDKGTGLVHIAPCHGKEDFYLMRNIHGSQSKYEVLIDDNGNFTDRCGPDLEGLSIFNDGLNKIINKLGSQVLIRENYTHNYPYDWRTKQPIIIRLSTQWFIDVEQLSSQALQVYQDQVDVYPARMKSAMISYISRRPNWCFSRQRSWGLPIPVLYNNSNANSAIIDAEFIDFIARKVAQEGSDFWWSASIDQLVSSDFLDKWNISSYDSLTKSLDIFDIWFDSGLSWFCRDKADAVKQADIYLEGLDQFRGWFSSSLLTSVAITGQAPYKSIICHGFAMDEHGQKMSKSLGNVIHPSDIINMSSSDSSVSSALVGGVDLLRYWACASGTNTQCNISKDLLTHFSGKYRAIRNMYRFLTGNIDGDQFLVNPDELINTDQQLTVQYQHLLPQDRYLLHKLADKYFPAIIQCYNHYAFESLTGLIEEMTGLISNSYFTIIKDRLYCDSKCCTGYNSLQTTLQLLLTSTLPLITPIFPCLAHEITQAYDNIELKWPNHLLGIWRDDSINQIYTEILQPMKQVLLNTDFINQFSLVTPVKITSANPWNNLAIEIWCADHQDYCLLKENGCYDDKNSEFSLITEMMRCANVKIFSELSNQQHQQQHQKSIKFVPVCNERWLVNIHQMTEQQFCQRCRRFIVANVAIGVPLCNRCSSIVNNYKVQKKSVT